MSDVMVCYRALEATCTGGYACFAIEHIEGCFTGDGDPDAVQGQYVAGLRQQLAGAVEALHWYAEACDPTKHRNGFGDVRQAIGQDKGQRARDALRGQS
jgi:hypothetical protein